ncbi:ATP-dependent DNA helicase sgs1 [Cryptotrichosporon argae]
MMALTATAQNKVQEDIIRSLKMEGCEILRQSFNRPNLHYEVRPKMKKVLDDMVAFIKTQGNGSSGIIYCSSRDKCETTAKKLRDEYGLRAWHYHAGMTKGDRRKMQEGWQDYKFEIIVATVAFGMGIDKPDVRYVIHHSLPRSLEGYYQETGRAGRDGNNSTCVLYYTYGDSKTVLSLIDRDKEMSPDQKQRQRESLNEVLRFCQNKTDCRRSQVLAFFNETFDPLLCHQGCDTCLLRDVNQYTVVDVSEDAVKAVRMIQAFDRRDKITLKMAAECFRGTRGPPGKEHILSNNPMFGQGKDWERAEADRLLQLLLMNKAFEEWYVTSKAGWSNAYLKLGPHAKDYLNGSKKMEMDFRQASPRKSNGALPKGRGKKQLVPDNGQTRLVPYAQRTKAAAGASPVVSNPLSRKRSRQQLAEEDQAFDDSAWGDEDYQPNEADPIRDDADETDVDEPLSRSKRRKSGANAPSAPIPIDDEVEAIQILQRSPDRKDTVSPATNCYEALKKLRDKELGKSKSAPRLTDEMLEMVAAIQPLNAFELGQIEGFTSAHVKYYQSKILGLTIKAAKSGAVAGGRATPAHVRNAAVLAAAAPPRLRNTQTKLSYKPSPEKARAPPSNAAASRPVAAVSSLAPKASAIASAFRPINKIQEYAFKGRSTSGSSMGSAASKAGASGSGGAMRRTAGGTGPIAARGIDGLSKIALARVGSNTGPKF